MLHSIKIPSDKYDVQTSCAGGIFMSANKSKGKGRVLTGAVLAIALTAVLCGIYALLVKNGKCTQEYSDIIISAAIAMSVLIASAVSNAGQGRGGIYGLALGLIYAAALVAVPLFAYPTEANWLKIIRIFAVSVVSGLIGGSIHLGKSNKSFHKSRKKRV